MGLSWIAESQHPRGADHLGQFAEAVLKADISTPEQVPAYTNSEALGPDVGCAAGAEQWFPADPWAEQAKRWPVSTAIARMGSFVADVEVGAGIVLLVSSGSEEGAAHDALPWVRARAAALIEEMRSVDVALRGVNIPCAVTVRRVRLEKVRREERA